MRVCISLLTGYGEKYGATFVTMASEINELGIHCLSYEKSYYGMIGSTVLLAIGDEIVQFKGYTKKKDKDFVMEVNCTARLHIGKKRKSLRLIS